MIPFQLPVEIICVLFFVFWVVPGISKKIKVPNIILYIIFGIIIGPYGIGLVDNDDRVKLLSDIGIMFIMFLAGLELNPAQIRTNKRNTTVYGILTIIIPVVIGFSIFHFVLDYGISTSILVALMFATQTLVSYPIVSRLGLTSKRSVITAVGGTIISDSVVLFSIGIVLASSKGNISIEYLLKFVLLIVGFIFIVLFLFPLVIKRYFSKIEESVYGSFSLVIFFLFLAGSMAHLVGLEPIIGAFLTGITLTKYIPKNSSLLSNLHFVGDGIFIPVFLFYVGMLIDYQAVITDSDTLLIAAILVIIAIPTKLFPAFISGKIFKFSSSEIGVLFGLTSAHAAVVIATALIGYNIGIISLHILNATVLLILISCIVSSIVTEHFGRKLVLESPPIEIDEDANERVVVPYANPETVDKLLSIAVNFTYPNPNNVIHPLTIVQANNEQYKETILINRKKITEFTKSKYSKDIRFNPVSRIDVNTVMGINRALKELTSTMLIIGWPKNIHRWDILGKHIDVILEENDIQTVISHINQPITAFKNIIVGVPDNANLEKGFTKWMRHISNFASNTNLPVTYASSDFMIEIIKQHCNKNLKEFQPSYNIVKYEDRLDYIDKLEQTTLFIILFAREKSISFETQSEKIINVLKNKEAYLNFIVIVPEQYPIEKHLI
ncbi:MAG: cation:proton antiporter [Bacteroidetes bacterium]|nr:cation:proton antiporter [Bacteroidota bacterium]